jgi:hypothetical protein
VSYIDLSLAAASFIFFKCVHVISCFVHARNNVKSLTNGRSRNGFNSSCLASIVCSRASTSCWKSLSVENISPFSSSFRSAYSFCIGVRTMARIVLYPHLIHIPVMQLPECGIPQIYVLIMPFLFSNCLSHVYAYFRAAHSRTIRL